MKTKTISLDKETYLELFRLVTEYKQGLEDDIDLSVYLDDGSISDWRLKKKAEAEQKIDLATKLYDAVLFGEV